MPEASVAAAVAAPRLRVRPAPAAFPSTARLLVDGGDARLALDPRRGTNRYGCRPFPDSELLAFGSSTASIVSETAYDAAERLRCRLLAAAETEPPAVAYAREMDRLRRELGRLCGLSRVPGTEIVFAASGTDLHLIAGQLAAAGAKGLRAITVEASETGSGVPAALAGRHFCTSTALGQAVIDGVSLPGAERVETVAVPGRAPDGALRAADEVAGDIAARAAEAMDEDRRVLLVLTDVSKTGILSPSVECALDLQRRHDGTVGVLVDACQLRLAPATLQAYLERGFMVAVTGSKFVTGPAFCGALLVPPRLARRFKERPLPTGLAAYSARGEWPRGWTAAEGLPDVANYGLLLRWQAALAELEAFASLPEDAVAGFVAEFGFAVRARFAGDARFEAVMAPPPDRRAISAPASWDRLPTIFPFLLRRPSGHLGRTETERVYELLAADVADQAGATSPAVRALAGRRCQVGQPVPCGERAGAPVHALRLCLSARLIVEAVGAGRGDEVIAQAMTVLDKAALIVDTV